MGEKRSRTLAVVLVMAMVVTGCAGSNKDKLAKVDAGRPEQSGTGIETGQVPGQETVAEPGGPDDQVAPGSAAGAESGGGAAAPGPSKAGGGSSSGATGSGSKARESSGGRPAAAPSGGPAAAVPGGGATDVGVTANEIKVGFMSELSGPIAVYGQSFAKATQAFFRYLNDQGGVNGRKFKLIVYDDAWDPVRGKAATKRLVEQDKVFALCCTQSLNTNAAITPYLDEVRVPNVGVDGLNDEQYKGAYTFPIGTASVPLGNLTGAFVPERLGAKKAALICENVSGGKQFCDAFQKNFEAKGGRVVYSQTVNPDEADLTPFVLQARAQGSEIITGHIDVVVAIRLLQAAQAQGWKPPKNFAFGTGVYVSIFPEYTGSISEGTVVMNHNLAWETESPGRREFRDVVSRYYDLKSLNYTPWLSLSGVSVKLFADGVRALGRDGVTREGLKNWLDNLTNWDTGWGFKVTFRPGKHVANRFGLFLQVKGGKFEPLTGLIEDKTYQG